MARAVLSLLLITWPEEARNILYLCFDNSICFYMFKLAEKLVSQKCTKVGEGQVDRRRFLIWGALHSLADTATGSLILVIAVYVADVNLLAIWHIYITTPRVDWSLLGFELRLVDGLWLATTPTE